MRAKRSKKYRKLMHQYELNFGFREPYQVLGTSLFFQRNIPFGISLRTVGWYQNPLTLG
jgi:U3 small nucleolar RNA-associated protein 23